MSITRQTRLALCALPGPGWGGCTLAGYTQTIGLRPDINGDQDECEQVLEALTQTGLVRALPTAESELRRWELTERGDAELMASSSAGAESLAGVLLDIQPSVGSTASATEGGAQ